MRCTEHAFYFVAPLFGKVALSFTPEQVGFLHALKGAPAGLLLILLLADRPIPADELALVSGYSTKTVHKGLQMLQAMALIRPVGDPHTWSLARNFAGLHTFFRPAQPGGEARVPGDAHGASTGREPATEKDFSPGSSTYTSTTTTSDPVREGVVASKYRRRRGKKSAGNQQSVDNSAISVDNQGYTGDNPGDKAVEDEDTADVRAWLERAGIGRNSPKMRTLLARRLDPYVVRAFVLDREYQLREGRGRGVNAALVYRPGLLIKKLEDGDPPPPMRCEDCLAVLPCYCGVIRR